MNLTQEQRAALVAASLGDDDSLPTIEWQKLDALGLAEWDHAWELTPAGRIVAELCKELADKVEDHEELARDNNKWARVMAYVVWRLVEECGELEPGEYIGRIEDCPAKQWPIKKGYPKPDFILCHPSGEPVKLPEAQ